MGTAVRRRRVQEIPDLIARMVPDAITASVLLTFTMVGLAAGLGNPAARILDAYHRGLWMLLQFTMQMTLIIVLSAALAITPFFRKTVARLASIPRTPKQVIVLAFLAAGTASYIYWGLGY